MASFFVLPPVIGLLVRNLDSNCHNSEALLFATYMYTYSGNFVYVPEPNSPLWLPYNEEIQCHSASVNASEL